MPVTFTEAGTIQSISIYHNGGTGNVLLGVYADQNGSPAARLGVTPSTLVNSAAGWQTVALTSPVTVASGQTVWLSWVFQTNPGVRFIQIGPAIAQSSASWSGGMPATFGTVATTKYLRFSIYCTYTESAVYLTVSPLNQDVGPEAGSTTITISLNTSWTVTDDADWLTISPTSGTNNGSLTANYTANPSSTSRTATITVSGIGVDPQNVTITQRTQSSSTIADIEGNVYKTVKIGNQWWMAENLKTTKYNDGTAIPYSTGWGELDGAYCWYNNDISYKNPYGALYNWYAVNTGKLCPTGWHVPSIDDWKTLTDYLGGGDNAGGKLKETGTVHWGSPNLGATNESGFTALPGGYRGGFEGHFEAVGSDGYFFCSELEGGHTSSLVVSYDNEGAGRGLSENNQEPYSVRCLKDNTMGNTDVYPNTNSTATNRRAMLVTFTEAGTIQSISICHNRGTGNVLLGVYADQSGSPAARLGVTPSTLVNPAAGWQTVALTSPVTVASGQTVWLSWVFQTNPGVRYIEGPPAIAQSSASWSGGMPATFGTVATTKRLKFSIYCNYTPGETAPYLNVSPTSVTLGSTSGSSGTFTITSNTTWSIARGAGCFFYVVPDGGSNNATITVTAGDNIGTSQRSATLIITGTGVSSKTVTVIQQSQPGGKTLGNTDVYPNTNSTATNRRALPVTFTEPGTIQSISIYHNGGTGNVLLGVYADQSGSPVARLGVTPSTLINPAAGWQTVALTSPVNVASGQTVWLSWVFQTNPGVRFTTGTPAIAQSSATWIGGMPATFGTVATTKNLKFSIYCTYVTYLTVSPLYQDVGAESGPTTLTISSNTSWTITYDADWLTISPTSGTNNGTLTANYTSNPPSTPRAASITVSGIGVDPQIVNISQGRPTNTDIDGNYYNTVIIGSQIWMAENLKTTKYNDVTAISHLTTDADWAAEDGTVGHNGAYCWYNNDISYKNPYGALYNWYAVKTGKLCPAGWHVPTDAEWTTLTTYLGGLGVAGGKLKETGTTHWLDPNYGATNETGFTGLPGSIRSYNGQPFGVLGRGGFWWSSDYYVGQGWYRVIGYGGADITRSREDERTGFSVRCLKDNTTKSNKEMMAIEPNPADISKEKVLIYPNPTEGNITVKWDNYYDRRLILTIYNSLGSPVKKVEVEPSINQIQLDLNNNQNGLYLLELRDMNGIIINRLRIVKY
jgi:uncharacterized protein (TIGR02145 family)